MLDEPEIKKKMPPGPVNSIFFVWADRNHDHAVQPNEVEFVRPNGVGSEGVVFQPDLSVISGGPYHLPAADVDEMGVPSYDLKRLQLVSSTAAHPLHHGHSWQDNQAFALDFRVLRIPLEVS